MSFYAVLKDDAVEDGISREIKGRKGFQLVKFLNQTYIPIDEFSLTKSYDIYKKNGAEYIDSSTEEFKSTGGKKSRKHKRSRKHKTKKNRF